MGKIETFRKAEKLIKGKSGDELKEANLKTEKLLKGYDLNEFVKWYLTTEIKRLQWK